MTPGLRKFALTTHVTSSVGWLGAVGAFLALAIAGVVIVRELRENSQLEDCLMSGRHNCAPIEVPSRR